MAKVAIYQVSMNAMRFLQVQVGEKSFNIDMIGYERDADIASAAVIEAVKPNDRGIRPYVYCARIKTPDADIVPASGREDSDDVTKRLLERTWELTNNLTDEGWANGEHVVYRPAKGDRQRSSQVGDIFVLTGASGEDEAWMVATCGFRKLSPAAAEAVVKNSIEGVALSDF